MGKYNSAIITTEGINMFASAIGGGDTVTFMTMQASSHAYPSTTDFMSLTSLQDVEATVNVNYAGVYSNNIVQVSARFDNDGVSTAYLINTLGLFAKLGNGEPKLVAVVTAQTPDQMPVYDANNPSAFIYNLQCTVQNAGSMAISVNPAGTVTVEQFNEGMATKLGRTDNAVSATKLQTSRSLTVDLGSTTSASFDGSADASIGVSGELPVANGGTGASTQAGARSALGVPPTNHAVANTTYGSGTATNYGHVKLSDTYNTVDANADAAHGVGASAWAMQKMYNSMGNIFFSGIATDSIQQTSTPTDASKSLSLQPGTYIVNVYGRISSFPANGFAYIRCITYAEQGVEYFEQYGVIQNGSNVAKDSYGGFVALVHIPFAQTLTVNITTNYACTCATEISAIKIK